MRCLSKDLHACIALTAIRLRKRFKTSPGKSPEQEKQRAEEDRQQLRLFLMPAPPPPPAKEEPPGQVQNSTLFSTLTSDPVLSPATLSLVLYKKRRDDQGEEKKGHTPSLPLRQPQWQQLFPRTRERCTKGTRDLQLWLPLRQGLPQPCHKDCPFTSITSHRCHRVNEIACCHNQCEVFKEGQRAFETRN